MSPPAAQQREELTDRIHDSTAVPLVCGILNVTPDSFSDGGHHPTVASAVDHGLQMHDDGADLIDVGGESTRPGARPPSVHEELARVIPVIEALARRCDTPISVDTSRAEVISAAVRAGAVVVNDVRALRRPGALRAASASGAVVCLTHMRAEPSTMQDDVSYADVTEAVQDFLTRRLQACTAAGVDRRRVLIDPGFGFGKLVQHNVDLLRRLPELTSLAPVMVGLSRKRVLGDLTGRAVGDRLAGSVAAAALAAHLGARVLRVHDVGPTRDAVLVVHALRRPGPSEG